MLLLLPAIYAFFSLRILNFRLGGNWRFPVDRRHNADHHPGAYRFVLLALVTCTVWIAAARPGIRADRHSRLSGGKTGSKKYLHRTAGNDGGPVGTGDLHTVNQETNLNELGLTNCDDHCAFITAICLSFRINSIRSAGGQDRDRPGCAYNSERSDWRYQRHASSWRACRIGHSSTGYPERCGGGVGQPDSFIRN